MSDPDTVARAFCDHYYALFDNNRQELVNLYTDDSMVSFEDKKAKGAQNIVQTLMTFPPVKHVPQTVEVQPCPPNGLLVFVSGDLKIDQEQNAVKYSQVFNLQTAPAGSLFVLNDMHRLNWG